MWETRKYHSTSKGISVLGVLVFCGSLEKSVCEEFLPCPANKRDKNGYCRSEEHATYNEYYIWIGIISGLVVLLGVALLSCVCCKCCVIYKRRIAIENARARNNANISTIASHPQIGHGAHGPVSNQFRVPVNPSLPRIDFQYPPTMEGGNDRQHLATQFHQQAPFGGADPVLPIYTQTMIPVFPDEPPPRYTP